MYLVAMTQKKEKNLEAENLISSLIDELQEAAPLAPDDIFNLEYDEKVDDEISLPQNMQLNSVEFKDFNQSQSQAVVNPLFPTAGESVDESVSDDRTLALPSDESPLLEFPISETRSQLQQPLIPENEKTVAVGPKMVVSPKTSREPDHFVNVNAHVSQDASLVQAENLKIAQQRILEMEREVEKLRGENEELSSAALIVKNKMEDYQGQIRKMENEKQEILESSKNELMILKGNLQYKEIEYSRIKNKNEELEIRIKADLKKIRVRERELENRLELLRAEKSALLKSKDEQILELKRKNDYLQGELDNFREKILELNKTIDLNSDQFKRTVRALRIALSNLEAKEDNVVPIKKAE